ncbi:hypothetical protein [Rhodocista pekingensis]|uniref:Uncharacterized protein n=1 Tax=Rhodocista pekingensis TaxID=201185 RepID=A0ABW2KUP0_9PROT
MAALLSLVAWGTTKVAVIEGRIGTLERAVDNDIASEPRVAAACLPVVEYSRDFQARAADELDLLPEGSAIAELLADYSVMRDQARRACNG